VLAAITKAQDLRRRTLHLWCCCSHSEAISLREAADRDPDMTIEDIARKVLGGHCGIARLQSVESFITSPNETSRIALIDETSSDLVFGMQYIAVPRAHIALKN
jgi:hypothetical protein